MKLQHGISLEKHQALVGKTIDILLEHINSTGSAVGRTTMDAPEIDGQIYIENSGGYLPADIIPVKITKGTAYDLYGVVEN